MKFNKILVVESKKKTEKHLESVRRLRGLLEDSQLSFSWIMHERLSKELLRDVDLVITLGGDGTFLEAANLVENSFILGINSHPETSEGALTSLSAENLEILMEILNGKFQILKRQRAMVKLNGNLIEEYATNEVYFGAASQFHSSRYIINFGDIEEEQRSSGVVISTGTGSGAWYLSAGGEVFYPSDEKLAFIVREPYFGKRLYSPKIIKGEFMSEERIILKCKRNFGGILAIGFKAYDLQENDVVEVSLSDNPLKVLEVKDGK
jgi:NAD+ kinase